jgi:methylmalonyl-CoA mutase
MELAMPKLFESFPKHTPKEWEDVAIASLKGRPLKSLETTLPGGLSLKPIYHPTDGEAPIHTSIEESTVAPEASWAICQEMQATSPADWNRLLKADIERKETRFTLRLDSGFRRAFAQGPADSWRPGVLIRGAGDLAIALDGITPRSTLTVETGLGFSFFRDLWNIWSKDNSALSQSIELEILVDPIEIAGLSGKLPYELSAIVKDLAEDIRSSTSCLKIASTLWAENALDAAKELALILASANSLFPGLLDEGVSLETLLGSTQIECGLDHRIFLQIAKQRALRLLWATFTEAFGATESQRRLTLMTRGLRRYQTRQDPWTNLLRSSLQGFGAAVGQTETMHLSTLYDGLGISGPFERRLAANSQVILKEEALLDKVADPARGSWYIEALTEAIAHHAWTHFQTLEKAGGIFTPTGAFQPTLRRWIDEACKEEEDRIFQSKAILVGTNRYPNKDLIAKTVSPMIELEPTSLEENTSEGHTTPDWPKLTLHGEDFLPPRAALAFEALFDQCAQSKATIWLSCFGDLKEYKARRDFCTQLFAAVGIDTPTDDGHDDIMAAAQATFSSGSSLCLICGKDDRYAKKVPAFIAALRDLESQAKKDPMPVWLAGRPRDLVPQLKEAGVETFVHLHSDLFDLCHSFLGRQQS